MSHRRIPKTASGIAPATRIAVPSGLRILAVAAIWLLGLSGIGRADICWSEPPYLDGMLYTSEKISQIDYETEVANDFQVHAGDETTLARWWGGYIHAGPATPHVTSFILRLYEDDGSCKPGSLIKEYDVPNNAGETLIYTQADGTQIYQYEANVSRLRVRLSRSSALLHDEWSREMRRMNRM